MGSPQNDNVNTATEPEKEGELMMSLDFNPESYWESAAFYQQSLVSTPLDNAFYEQGPLGLAVRALHFHETPKPTLIHRRSIPQVYNTLEV